MAVLGDRRALTRASRDLSSTPKASARFTRGSHRHRRECRCTSPAAPSHQHFPLNRQVDDTDRRADIGLDLRGRGLPPSPSVFVDRRVLWPIRDTSPPLAVYPARAAATLWATVSPAPGGLAAVLGLTRA